MIDEALGEGGGQQQLALGDGDEAVPQAVEPELGAADLADAAVEMMDGEAIIVRYADDIVVGFQHKRDAERYLRDVRERLARFGLSLHQDKTRLVEFGRFAVMNRRQRGVGKPETFDFLGLTHYCTTTLRGRFRLGRKPVAKRVNRTLARIDEVLRKRWHHDIWEVGRWRAYPVVTHTHYI